MATVDQAGRVLDDELSPVVVTARKIDPATGEPLPVLEEFSIMGKRYAGIDWKNVLVVALIGWLVIEVTKPKGRRR